MVCGSSWGSQLNINSFDTENRRSSAASWAYQQYAIGQFPLAAGWDAVKNLSTVILELRNHKLRPSKLKFNVLWFVALASENELCLLVQVRVILITGSLWGGEEDEPWVPFWMV